MPTTTCATSLQNCRCHVPDLFLDTETFSPVNLRTAGSYRYAEEAEVMLLSWALDDGPEIGRAHV